MFFLMGITQERRDLDFTQLTTCEICGSYGRYCVFVTYSVLSLFFIPIWKWNRHYYVEMSCCGSIYELNENTGRMIENGQEVRIEESDLRLLNRNHPTGSFRKCSYCGYETEEDFEYCPKCGNRFN